MTDARMATTAESLGTRCTLCHASFSMFRRKVGCCLNLRLMSCSIRVFDANDIIAMDASPERHCF